MNRRYDLAIVGASFAGLAAAERAAQRGLRTVVLERKERVRTAAAHDRHFRPRGRRTDAAAARAGARRFRRAALRAVVEIHRSRIRRLCVLRHRHARRAALDGRERRAGRRRNSLRCAVCKRKDDGFERADRIGRHRGCLADRGRRREIGGRRAIRAWPQPALSRRHRGRISRCRRPRRAIPSHLHRSPLGAGLYRLGRAESRRGAGRHRGQAPGAAGIPSVSRTHRAAVRFFRRRNRRAPQRRYPGRRRRARRRRASA